MVYIEGTPSPATYRIRHVTRMEVMHCGIDISCQCSEVNYLLDRQVAESSGSLIPRTSLVHEFDMSCVIVPKFLQVNTAPKPFL